MICICTIQGCWRTDAVSPASEWLKVPSDIPAAYASTLLVNPCTSYRLITDFGDLKEGEGRVEGTVLLLHMHVAVEAL